jgi:spore coat polysaccharide biosynthesis predicted glycosyltransferase SpsG
MTPGSVVALRCDAGALTGTGHVVRCVALAEELAGRGAMPVFLGTLGGVPFVEAQVRDRGFDHVELGDASVAGVAAAVRELDARAVVLDSYTLPAGLGEALRAAGAAVLAVVDDDTRGIDADVYVEQNYGSEALALEIPPDAVLLAGVRNALLRDVVRRRRPPEPRPPSAGTPHVVAFFGGTDAFGAAPTLVAAMAATGRPFDAQVVAAGEDARAALRAVQLDPGQTLELLDPVADLPALLVDADLVVSAAGTSTWELLCLGVPAALVAVVDNQEASFARLRASGLVAPLGLLSAIAADPAAAVAQLGELLAQPEARSALGARAWAAVDGDGRVRVVDALDAVLDARG